MSYKDHYEIVIVGGGTAGISAAVRLRKALDSASIAIIDPAPKHFYQPLWTLVGAGVSSKEQTARPLRELLPKDTELLEDAAAEFFPEENFLLTKSGKKVKYSYLIVAAGIQLNWDKVKGLKESIGKNGVCSNYSYDYVDSTWEALRNFKGGNAVFTHPNTPIKCGGAPMKIMYLADDYLRRKGIREKAQVLFASANSEIFHVPKYAKRLDKVVSRKNIQPMYRMNLIEVRPETKEAVFEHLDTGEKIVQPYDLLHVTPPMSPPDFIKESPLSDANGWVDVDPRTLQHSRFENIFGLGDSSNLPTSKTGAAIRKQVPVMVQNLLSVREGLKPSAKYDGYSSCPIVTGFGKLILAEFDYEKNIKETFPFDQSKERWSMYFLKRYILPIFYWKGMLKGRM